MQRLVTIALIWLGCSVAWVLLGSSLLVRSGERSSALADEVHALWGPPLAQYPPRITAAPGAEGKQARGVQLGATELDVKLDLEHRKKGLLWFPTYGVRFGGRYTFLNADSEPLGATIEFPLQRGHAVYDTFDVAGAAGEAVDVTVAEGVARWQVELKPGERRSYVVRYRSRGTSRWLYHATAGAGEARNFELKLTTNFTDVDFVRGSLSPARHRAGGDGWTGYWKSPRLVAAAPIGLELPQKLNPGPLASRITFFAPVGLLFYFFVVTVLAAGRTRPLHPLNYFFFGAAFFSFHLLFAYLVDHLPLAVSFAIAALVSVALVLSYARLIVGWRRALREIAAAQLVYLVLFSVTFFWAGFTGLAITVGAVATLAVMMQITARRQIGVSAPERALGCATPYRCAEAALAAGPHT